MRRSVEHLLVDGDVLALCSERQSMTFLREGCLVPGVERVVVTGDESDDERERVLEHVIAWARAHTEGRVVSLGDAPSVVHALAQSRAPELEALRHASLNAIIATLDKAFARREIAASFGSLAFAELRLGDEVIPAPGHLRPGAPVIVKPLAGTSSMGLHVSEAGAPAPEVSSSGGQVSRLIARRFGRHAIDPEVVGLVEEYVPADVPRVSVDGWIDREGRALRFAISDNIYVEGEPERFSHQMVPTHLSETASAACWELWEAVAKTLSEHHGLRDQFFDVEMFVFEGDEPRAEIMEINCRVHPNITPVLARVCRGAHTMRAHFDDPVDHASVGDGVYRAGAMFYVWSEPGASLDEGAIDGVETSCDVLACVFDGPGYVSGGLQCRGWLYVFGDDHAEVLETGTRVLRSIVQGA